MAQARYSSFISEPWFDMYLSNRQELPLNINPQLTFKDDPTKTTAVGLTPKP
jgi:carnitine O-palmitoyltransferase 2